MARAIAEELGRDVRFVQSEDGIHQYRLDPTRRSFCVTDGQQAAAVLDGKAEALEPVARLEWPEERPASTGDRTAGLLGYAVNREALGARALVLASSLAATV